MSSRRRGSCSIYLKKNSRRVLKQVQYRVSIRRNLRKDPSISHRVQRLAKYRFLKKQSDLLLNADDLDAIWVCLRENCVIDLLVMPLVLKSESLAHFLNLPMNYEDSCHIASVCTEEIGPKCCRFFSPSNFMKFKKDDSGRIAILPFYLLLVRTVCFSYTGQNIYE